MEKKIGVSMELLDQSIDQYEMHELSEFGTGKIFSFESKQIGSIKRKEFSIQSEIRVLDSDDVSICTITKKVIGVKSLYYVNSAEGGCIGTVRAKVFKLRSVLNWYDTDDKHVLAIKSDIAKRKFLITEPKDKNKTSAEIIITSSHMVHPSIDSILKNKCIVRIIDKGVSRLSLVVSAIIIMMNCRNTEMM